MSQIHREQLTVVAEKAILVGVALPGDYLDAHDPLGELRSLAETAGVEVVGELFQRRTTPSGRTYLGKGKTEELSDLVRRNGAKVVIFDNDLSPAQVRNIEQVTSCKIVDRSELILDIFANRATTHAAKLQVEIAQLEYTYPRLRAMWDHLGQVAGGAPVGVGTRGPGEQQIEIDRRLVQNRLQKLKRNLHEIQERNTREVSRRKLDHFTVGLVGYTNAGKSTLFNRLTSGGAFAHPKLFATLATRVEKWDLGGGNSAMLSDTVGFIRNLPHHLVASFRSTLEQTIISDLILVVLDISDPHSEMQLDTVNSTLDEIGASSQPRLLVLNKIDQVADSKVVAQWQERYPNSIALSAATGEQVSALCDAVMKHFLGDVREIEISVPMADTRSITFIEQRTQVSQREYVDSRAMFRVSIGRRQMNQLLALGAQMTINGLRPDEAVPLVWGDVRVKEPPRIPPHHREEHVR